MQDTSVSMLPLVHRMSRCSRRARHLGDVCRDPCRNSAGCSMKPQRHPRQWLAPLAKFADTNNLRVRLWIPHTQTGENHRAGEITEMH